MTPQITLQNVEEYLLLSLDGELNEAEQAALTTFLEAHPELATLVAEYQDTIVPPPEPALLYDAKESLLQPEAVVRNRMGSRPVWWAAAALLLVAAGTYFTLRPPDAAPALATQTTAPANQIQAVPEPVVPVTQAPAQPAVSSTAIPATTPTIASSSSNHTLSQPEPSGNVMEPSKEGVPSAQEDIPMLPVVAATSLQEPRPALPEMNLPVALAPVGSAPAATSPLTVDLPILNTLREAATEKAAQIRTVRRELKNTETTFEVAGYELFTIRF
ncbi:MAG: hypothetical protein EOP52_00460 [Sphingobacteriales bacterium]|nr:MAG: hypothetical protein EOP52_00460 [Sphingobacteriales bacterium]